MIAGQNNRPDFAVAARFRLRVQGIALRPTRPQGATMQYHEFSVIAFERDRKNGGRAFGALTECQFQSRVLRNWTTS